MLPLDGLWLNASKPEPSLETYVTCQNRGISRMGEPYGISHLQGFTSTAPARFMEQRTRDAVDCIAKQVAVKSCSKDVFRTVVVVPPTRPCSA